MLELVPDPREVAQVVVIQAVEEESTQVGMLPTPRVSQQRAPGGSEHRQETALVVVRGTSLHEAAALEPIGETGEAARRHQPLPSQVGHPHPVRARAGEERQNAVLGHAHAERCQPRLDVSPDLVMRAEEPLPGVVFELRQPGCSHGVSL
nr:hypothetical protein [Homoserinibacter gongjuensis]